MGFMGIGFRRKRQETVLDVVYSTIISDVDTIQSMVTSFSINGAGTMTLTADTYDQCRSLYFLDLPSPIPNASEYANIDVVLTYLTDPMAPITGTEDAYFRLQLLSQRCLRPHAQNLAGIFGFLPNLAWTNQGPVYPEDVAQLQCHAMLKGIPLQVTHVDKFPYMVNYHIPKGVRIADASRVRLGAYLGEGTTIMPAGFVNFNAGTLGNAMVEGRVSAGVVIGEDSDVGGGASIMGTLSG
ncbi:MAG: 2,3,4,5-tetrahydropyridine-2,6-dicarboxylate N-succinyltransferase, partial [Candidatus Marinamargulisbacteria bacterium]